MKRLLKTLALVSALALAVFAVTACSSPEVSRSSESFSAESVEVEETVETDPTYILVVGNDSRYGTSEAEGEIKETDPSFGDTIMLMRVDPDANRIGIVSIPRDTAYDINGNPDKINSAHYLGGPTGLAQAVGDLLGVDVPYYVDAKFVDFAALVDKLGGVTVNVPMGLTGGDIIYGNDITLEAGENTLDGVSALMLARQRKVYPSGEGEAVRQMISREMVANAIQEVASQPSDTADAYAEIVSSTCDTNMTDAELEAYIAAFMDNPGAIEFSLGTTTLDGYTDETGSWRIHADADTCAQIVNVLENGGDLSAIVPNPSIY